MSYLNKRRSEPVLEKKKKKMVHDASDSMSVNACLPACV